MFYSDCTKRCFTFDQTRCPCPRPATRVLSATNREPGRLPRFTRSHADSMWATHHYSTQPFRERRIFFHIYSQLQSNAIIHSTLHDSILKYIHPLIHFQACSSTACFTASRTTDHRPQSSSDAASAAASIPVPTVNHHTADIWRSSGGGVGGSCKQSQKVSSRELHPSMRSAGGRSLRDLSFQRISRSPSD